MELQGKTVLVTGAARRVGRVIAKNLASHGAHVMVHYGCSSREAQGLVQELKTSGAKAMVLVADLADPQACERLAREAEAKGPVDVLINNASIFPRTPLETLTAEDWDKNMAVNLRAPFLLSLYLGRAMKKRGQGKIINIIDWAAHRPYKNYLPYCVSKGGLVTLTQTLALELAPEVMVNGIAPGPVLPPEDFNKDDQERLRRQVPLQKLGSPQDVAAAVCFLIEGSDFITGAILPVDGGRLIA